jgi:hypothetical protein
MVVQGRVTETRWDSLARNLHYKTVVANSSVTQLRVKHKYGSQLTFTTRALSTWSVVVPLREDLLE